MAYDANGKWTPEDDGVQGRLQGLLQKDNPLMAGARASGARYANKRGLANSSMAAQASQKAQIDVALPIAGQEAGQVAQKNLASQSQASSERIASSNIAAHNKQYSTAAVLEVQKKYGALEAELVKNNDLNVTARNKYLSHFAALRDSDMNLVEQLYGIDLDWETSAIQV